MAMSSFIAAAVAATAADLKVVLKALGFATRRIGRARMTRGARHQDIIVDEGNEE